MCPTVRNDQHNKWSRARAEVVDEEAYRLRNSFEGWVETLKKKACSDSGFGSRWRVGGQTMSTNQVHMEFTVHHCVLGRRLPVRG